MIALSKLFKNKDFLRFANSLHEGVVCLDHESVIIFCNKAAEKILGIPASQMAGKIFTNYQWQCVNEHGGDLPGERRPVAVTFKTGQPQQNVVMGVQQLDGQVNWVKASTEAVFSDDSSIISGIILSFVDITEQKKTDDAIRETKDFYESVINNIAADVAVFDSHYKYIFANKHKIEDEELRQWIIGKDDFEYCRKQGKEIHVAEERVAKHREADESNSEVQWEEELKTSNGTPEWRLWVLKPFTNGNQALQVAYGVNITALKKMQLELAAKENQLRTLINTLPDVLFRIDKCGRFIDFNFKDAKLMAMKPEDFLGKTVYEVWAEEIAGFHMGFINLAFAGEELVAYEYPIENLEGEILYFEGRIKKMNEEEVLMVSRDITESKRQNELIKESERLLAQSQELSHIGSWEWDLKSNKVIWTNELYRIVGFTPTARDLTFEDYLSSVHPDDKERVNSIVQQAYNDQQPYSFFYRIVQPNGEMRILLGMGEIETDENGQAVKMRGVAQDVTEKKRAEENLDKLNNELIASNKELEEFAYVVSHDLQEPIRMVGSFLNLLIKKMDGQLDETTQKYIHFAVDGAERMKIMIQDLLQYSHLAGSKENFVATDLNEAMEYTTRVLQENIIKSHAIVTVGPMPVITANKTLITQLFVNLLSNALKFIGDQEPNIEVGYTENEEQWIFRVKDNGIGIEPKNIDRIFIIFQRAHSTQAYPGTGIGLSACKRIVEIHEGKIWVESVPGKGSTFYFSIPK